jgi:hypothetical protein
MARANGDGRPGGLAATDRLRHREDWLYSRAVVSDMIDEMVTSGPPGRPVPDQAAGTTLWLIRNMFAGS